MNVFELELQKNTPRPVAASVLSTRFLI